MDAPRYECRWCSEQFRFFRDLMEHANESHPVEFERAITARRLALV